MKRPVENWRLALMSLIVVATTFALPVSGYAQVPVPAVQESITVSTSSPLTEANLDGSEVTVTLAGRTFERSIFSIRRAVSVSGIAGVTVGTFGITRASDTKLTIELDFNGDFDEDGTLRFYGERGGQSRPTTAPRSPGTCLSRRWTKRWRRRRRRR